LSFQHKNHTILGTNIKIEENLGSDQSSAPEHRSRTSREHRSRTSLQNIIAPEQSPAPEHHDINENKNLHY
jgi:hypothetical protein